MLGHPLGVLSAAGGRPARYLTLLDRMVAVGPRHAIQHRRLTRRLSSLGSAPDDAVYGPIWREAAAELGAQALERPGGYLEIRGEGVVTRVRYHRTPLDDASTWALSLDKPLVHERLVAAGVPVPAHLEFTLGGIEAARQFLRNASGPVIVKPASGTSSGAGVTGGVRSGPDLVRAAVNAARFGRRLLVEEHAAGDMYRILLLDGEPLDLLRRNPPRLRGDGRSTIRDLVVAENRRRLAACGRNGFLFLKIDLDSDIALRRAGYTPRSVPLAGKSVTLKSSSSEAGPGDNETMRTRPSEELLAEVASAAAAIGVRLAGVDIITGDLSRGLREAGGFVIEVNCPAGLHYHYQVRDPERATRVAVPVLRAALDDAKMGRTSQ